MDLARIKEQLDEAAGRAASGGEFSNPAWFSRARYAKRMTGLLHQQILMELARRRKITKQQDISTPQRFMNICKVRLDEELFAEILQEASEA